MACAAAAAFVAGCNSGPLTPSPRLAGSQALRVEIDDQPATLDPGQTQYSYETAVLRAIAEPLLRPAADLSGVVPAAASSYSVSAGGTVYTFQLRQTARYWDGAPVRAQDFVYAWQRIIDPRLASPVETFFADAILNGDRVSVMDPQRDAATIDAALGTLGLKAVDDYTFQVTLAQPDLAFPWLAALPAAAPIRKDVVTKSGDQWAASPDSLVTNGPFRVSEMVPNDSITVVPNPDYWGPKPTLTSIKFVVVHDGATALAMYRSGELDETSVQPAQAALAASDATLSRQLVKLPDLTVFWFAFRVDAPPLDNVKVRQAIAEAIDRNAFVAQIFQGQGQPAESFIPEGMLGYDSGLLTQHFDVAQAHQSLEASGLSAAQLSGITFTYDMSSDFGKATAAFVRDQLKANLGVDVSLKGVDSNTLSSRLATGDFQLAGPMGWAADYPDPADWYDIFTTTSSNNISLYQNSQFDQLVRVAKTDQQRARRTQEYLQAQRALVTDSPVVFLAQSQSWYLVHTYVRGVVTSSVEEWPGALAPWALSVALH